MIRSCSSKPSLKKEVYVTTRALSFASDPCGLSGEFEMTIWQRAKPLKRRFLLHTASCDAWVVCKKPGVLIDVYQPIPGVTLVKPYNNETKATKMVDHCLIALATIINHIDRSALAVMHLHCLQDELGFTNCDYAIMLNVFMEHSMPRGSPFRAHVRLGGHPHMAT